MKKKHPLAALLAALSALMLALPTSAHETIPISLDGTPTTLDARLVESTTYVPLEEADRMMSEKAGRSVEISAVEGKPYIAAHGRFIGGAENRIIDGVLFVPIRSIAKIYGVEVDWNGGSRSVSLDSSRTAPISNGNDYYIADELYWLARIIHAESGAEPLEGKILVGNVVLNRVRSDEFPDTVYDVIFDSKYGVQFSPTANGMIYLEPSAESVLAAKLVLDGYSLSREALYFLNPRIATSFWIVENRRFLTSVGGHDFYA